MDLMNGKQDFNLKFTFETYAPIINVVMDFNVKSLNTKVSIQDLNLLTMNYNFKLVFQNCIHTYNIKVLTNGQVNVKS